MKNEHHRNFLFFILLAFVTKRPDHYENVCHDMASQCWEVGTGWQMFHF